jgi:hypothetical protein
MIYVDWGFTTSPFQTTSLPANDLGERLLVGRAEELEVLIRRIESGPKLATIEGLNGIGKTSIVNVACYKLLKDHFDGSKSALYIPCRKIFQLNSNQDIQSFIDSVLLEIAQTLIDKASEIKGKNWPKTGGIDRWLNSPQLSAYQGGVSLMQFGAQLGKQTETNASVGFERSGFRKAIFSWLEHIFPKSDSGGIICTIDNLELLQSSETARVLLEQLRDELFNIPGLRWVLCGALGIVYGVVSSPRLEGFLHKPLEISGIKNHHASEILTSRIEAYAMENRSQYLPLLSEDFVDLYNILQGNLRSVLSYSDDYCQWVVSNKIPSNDKEKHDVYLEWISGQSKDAYNAVKQDLRPRALELFRDAVKRDGIFSPSDYEFFKFNSIPAFRPHIRDLEAVGLLVSTQDDGDKRRKTIQITPKGWIVNYYFSISKVGE